MSTITPPEHLADLEAEKDLQAPDSLRERVFPHSLALDIAEDLVKRWKPLCSEIHIAGSLARRRPMVHDIDIVCVPLLVPVNEPDAGLLDTLTARKVIGQRVPLLDYIGARDERLTALKGLGRYGDNGDPWLTPRMVEYRLHEAGHDDIPVDVYLATPMNLPCIKTIRTGSKHFSHALVSHAKHRGLWLGARLWRPDQFGNPKTPLTVADEANLFDWLGLPWVDPVNREHGEWQKQAPGLCAV